MNPLNPLFAFFATLVALAAAWLLVRIVGAPKTPGRYQAIDGLRGYLALFVVFHHASIWYAHLKGEPWRLPESNLYSQFGQGCVTLFFMITGFLFFTKLLESGERGVDWIRLFVSRVLRVTPLFFFAVLMLVLVVLVQTRFVLRVPLWMSVRSVLSWLCFNLTGFPDINGLNNTEHIVAGATWTLRYEWLFYFALPLLFAAIKGRVRPFWLGVSLIGVLVSLFWHPSFRHLLQFGGGIAAALVVQKTDFRQRAGQKRFSFLALLCIVVTVAFFHTSDRFVAIVLLTCAFTIMAAGNTLFGILTRPVSRYLGEISYSIYLLHGIVLYTTIHWVAGQEIMAASTPLVFWMIISASLPLLLVLSTITFFCIEKPGMGATDWVTQRIRTYRQVRRERAAAIL